MATYTRPAKVRYVDMAIFVDSHIYEENKSEALISQLYQYIYHLCYMLACKGKYFRKYEDYDDFALFAAAKIYLRMTNPRQLLDKADIKYLEKIRSVLNYTKLTLHGMKVDYQQENFSQMYPGTPDKNLDKYAEDLRRSIRDDYKVSLMDEISNQFKLFPNVIKEVISQTPYKKDLVMMKNLYISCVLTFLRAVTLPEEKKLQLEGKKNDAESSNKTIDKAFTRYYRKNNSNNIIVLWHLDDDMLNYVTVLFNKLKKTFCADLLETSDFYEISDTDVDNIMFSG